MAAWLVVMLNRGCTFVEAAAILVPLLVSATIQVSQLAHVVTLHLKR